jgi:hypothetical protein
VRGDLEAGWGLLLRLFPINKCHFGNGVRFTIVHNNTTSAFVATQQAALAFNSLPDSASKTFIYTGNILNETTIAPLMDLGVGKSATAHVVKSAAEAYKDKGFKYVLQ